MLNRPNPNKNSRTYFVDICGKAYCQTREHIRPKSTPNMDNYKNPPEHAIIPVKPPITYLTTPVEDASDTPDKSFDLPDAESPKLDTPDITPHPKSQDSKDITNQDKPTTYQPRSYSTRSGKPLRSLLSSQSEKTLFKVYAQRFFTSYFFLTK